MELKRPVEITITGTQLFSASELFPVFAPDGEKGEDRCLELTTDGFFVADEEGYRISYDETDLTGMEGCRSTFALSDGVLSFSREGKAQSHMIFEEGKRCQLYQAAPALPMCISCHRLKEGLTPRGGELSVDFSVEVLGSTVEHNIYTIRVDL